MVGRLDMRVAVGLVATLTACSDPDPGTPNPMAGGSAGAPATGGGGGSGAAGEAGATGAAGGSLGGAGGMPHVPPMRLADDPTGITGLEDCALAVDGACLAPLERSKEEVCERWQADRPQQATALQMPQALECDPGMSAPNSLEDALRRLNLFRWLGDAPPLALDPEWNDYARACAIIQAHIGPDITHFPENTAPCFTEKGYTASGQSQLASGSPNPAAAIDALIFDSGDNNFHILGHRQGMLHPGTTKVGLGFAAPPDALPATCVRTFDGSGVPAEPGVNGVYTFPSRGYQPWEVLADATYRESGALLEWSISLPYDSDATSGQVRLLRLRGSTWEDVPVTAGPFLDANYFGLWVNVGVTPIEPGTYAVIVSGTSLGPFGYQIRLEQCTEVPLSCDIYTQDCGDGFGCYSPAAPFCRQSQGLPIGAPCTAWDNAECAAGADCLPGRILGSDTSTCSAYCKPDDPSSPQSCDTLCPGAYIEIYGEDPLAPVAVQCLPGAGGVCDPLAPQCDAGQSCQDYEPAACRAVGTTAIGEECDFIAGSCVAGATCIGIQGSTKRFCEPYCDTAPAAAGANACATLCPNGFFEFGAYGVCIPPE